MFTVNIREYEDTFVVQFGTDGPRVNAYTLASTLVAIADAAKAANAAINPGFELEILVEAVEPGSFKAKVKAIYQGAGNLFSAENVKAIVLGVISTYIYTHTLERNRDVSVTVNSDEVVIQQGATRIVVPREVHEATKRLEQVPEFRSGISRAFQAIAADPDVSYLAVTATMTDADHGGKIPRGRFAELSEAAILEQPGVREHVETTEVQITRAILERGRKRWQFVWRGVRISAPVSDDRFYDGFFAHEVTVAPGDSLQVRLRVRQHRDPDTGIYVNDPNGYDVLEVIQHKPRGRQQRAPLKD